MYTILEVLTIGVVWVGVFSPTPNSLLHTLYYGGLRYKI